MSSTPEAANRGSNMIDNNLETRWTCFMSGEYALLDLGETLDVNGVAMAFGNRQSEVTALRYTRRQTEKHLPR